METIPCEWVLTFLKLLIKDILIYLFTYLLIFYQSAELEESLRYLRFYDR